MTTTRATARMGTGLRVRLTQIDGKLPNVALMQLGRWHRSRGDDVVLTRSTGRDLLEPPYDVVYASVLFDTSAPKLERFLKNWPEAIVGGTGAPGGMKAGAIEIKDVIGLEPTTDDLDYSLYPGYENSIGYTQRGCRFKCKWCMVPTREGKVKPKDDISSIWRGGDFPKNLVLLDNDFFGQPKDIWKARLAEIRDGDFRVSMSQGINVRVLTPEIAREYASVEFRDTKFRERRLYTAWDSLGDERMFFKGIDMLEDAGIPPTQVMAYMVTGFAEGETWADIHHRFDAMVARGVMPYPMVYRNPENTAEHHQALKRFQRWALTGLYRAVPFAEYDIGAASARLRQERGRQEIERLGQMQMAL